MVIPYALQRYSDYVDTLDAYVREHSNLSEDECLDLLSPGEAVDLCIIRDQVNEAELSVDQQRELERLDGLLVKHAHVVAENLPPSPGPHLRSHWWWFLHEGSQVREQAKGVA